MLGFGETDKPTNPEEYTWDKIAKDMIEIFDEKSCSEVISIGHDRGSLAASRLYHFCPSRVVGLVNINVGYRAPWRQGYNLDSYNAWTEKLVGYPIYMYHHFFTAPDAPEILKNNAGRLFHVFHGDWNNVNLKELFCTLDGLRNYLLGNDDLPKLRPCTADAKMKQAFIDRMNRDGFDEPQCWYKAQVSNLHYVCEKELPEGIEKVKVPVLYLGGKGDIICRPEFMAAYIEAGLLPNLTQEPLFDAGHWTPLEVSDKLVTAIGSWLENNYN